jgi:hypothetical protein
MTSPPPFDRFLRHAELGEVIHALAAEHPELCAVEVIGTSHEGRDIWLVTITDATTGPHDEKPAVWVDANIHATELTGSVAALHLIWHLLSGHAEGDERIRRALATSTYYVVPRVNPDGAEAAVADDPRYVRSSIRPWPRDEQQDGLVQADIDGDGRILQMRIIDRNGPWRTDTEDPRLLVPRDPDDDGTGTYYRLLPEGLVHGKVDPDQIKVALALAGLDLNRNFPVEWRPHDQQAGAGPYPTSEPEIRALVEAIVCRPNIVTSTSYHTYSGVHLRPYGTKADTELPTFDLRVYEQLGAKATSITSYPAVSTFHDFNYDPKEVITGVADDWCYDHLGHWAWTTELWSPLRAAGIDTGSKVLEWMQKPHPVEDERKLLAFSDAHLGGAGFVDWYAFDHPQLGPVELGGWHGAHWWRNPPPDRLLAEITPHSVLAVWHGLINPRLRLRSLTVTAVGAGAWKVRLVVENQGWLPTNGTERAVQRKAVRALEAAITVPDGVEVQGPVRLEADQLTGRAGKLWSAPTAADPTSDRAVFDFYVSGPEGAVVRLEAVHQRAGVVRAEATLT